jgi:hypothetical protein
MEKIHGQKTAFSLARKTVHELTAKNESASEHPWRETLWMIIFSIVAVSLFVDWWNSSSHGSVGGALFFLAIAVVSFVHLVRTTSVVTLSTDHGKVRVAVGAKVSEDELSELMHRLHDEFGWPARGNLRLPETRGGGSTQPREPRAKHST